MKETVKNLAKAFIGESQARNRYTYYAQVARDEGYEQIGAIFEDTANQEKTHAKRIFEHIQDLKREGGGKIDEIVVDGGAVPTAYGTTAENLEAAIAGENWEHARMYPEFAEVAEKEGYSGIAQRLRSIAKAEEHHEERYRKLLKEVKAETVFKKEKEIWWTCRECGYQHFGIEAPKRCPSCDREQAFYQVKCEEF
jgi:rubrerythrin